MHRPWNLCYFPTGNKNSWNYIFLPPLFSLLSSLPSSLSPLHSLPLPSFLSFLLSFFCSSRYASGWGISWIPYLMESWAPSKGTLSQLPNMQHHMSFPALDIPIFLLVSNTLNLGDEETQTSFCALLQPLPFSPTHNPSACLGWRKLTFCQMLSFLLPVTSMEILHSDLQTFLLGTWRKFLELKNSLHSQRIRCFRMGNVSKMVSAELWLLHSSQHLPSSETYWFNN